MDKEKFLSLLVHDAEGLITIIEQLKRSQRPIHHLDLELIQEKLRNLYDLTFAFTTDENGIQDRVIQPVVDDQQPVSPANSEVAMEADDAAEPMPVKEKEKKEPVIMETKSASATIEEAEEVTDIPAMVPEVNEEVIAAVPEAPEEEDMKDKDPLPAPDNAPEIKVQSPPPAAAPQRESHGVKEQPVKTNFDLFSAVADPSLGDRLAGASSDRSVAGKMEKVKLDNIRSAIGINDKFLFVNELFKGDLSRYNRVIDELNGMQTQQGARTYLAELKVEGQWPDDLTAFIKLREIVDRKY